VCVSVCVSSKWSACVCVCLCVCVFVQFHEKHALGGDGLYWLRVQMANLYGQDKLSLNDRVTWTEVTHTHTHTHYRTHTRTYTHTHITHTHVHTYMHTHTEQHDGHLKLSLRSHTSSVVDGRRGSLADIGVML